MRRGEALDQEIGEGTHLGRKVAAARIDDVDVERRRLVVAQDRDQPAGAHVRADDEVGLARDPHAGRGERFVEATVIRVHRTRDPHLTLAALRVAERPDVAARRIFVGEADVPGEILRRLRLAVAIEVRRCRAAHDARRADQAPDEILAAGVAHAHREVEAFLHDVDDAFRELDVEAHLRVARGERRDRRREMARGEGRRAREPQRAARHDRRRRDGDLGLLEIGQELHAALEEHLAGFRQRQPARRAVEKPRVEVGLEVGDKARHRRDRHAEPLHKAREAAGLDSATAKAVKSGSDPSRKASTSRCEWVEGAAGGGAACSARRASSAARRVHTLERHGEPKTPEDLTRHVCLTYEYWPSRNLWTFRDPNGGKHRARITGP